MTGADPHYEPTEAIRAARLAEALEAFVNHVLSKPDPDVHEMKLVNEARRALHNDPPVEQVLAEAGFVHDGLSEVWKDAEAALPEYAVGMSVGHAYYRGVGGDDFGDGEDLRVSQRYYAGTITGPSHPEVGEYGPTPAAALQALAARLREAQGGG